MGGDSGSPVLTQDGKIVAMHQWGNSVTGGGILAQYIRYVLDFPPNAPSKWYGTTTFPYNGQVCQ